MHISQHKPEKLSKILQQMMIIRKFEEKLNDLFSRGLLFGTSHLCIGQEATAVGACSALKKEDFAASNHRGHGHAIAKGVNLKQLAAELLGREEGLCRGRGGTQHLSDMKAGFLGTNGITGGFIPIAAGAALSFKMKGEKRVILSFFGDGAANTGVFHESLNFASLRKLPIIFFCENNLYAMSMPIKQSCPTNNIADRAAAYCIPGIVVDGMDPLTVESAVNKARDRALAGEGPSLIEAVTYRFTGHSKSDMRVYRTKEEENDWKKKDPIKNMKSKLIEEKIFTDKYINKLEEDTQKEVDEAVNYALALPYPCPDDLQTGLYTL